MGYIRHPRVVVQTGAGSFSPIECSVHASQHQSADTFSATFAMDQAFALIDAAPIDVTITAANDYTGGFKTMITGQADKIHADFNTRQIKISGRDKTSKLTDQKTTEKWQNRKPEEVIQDLAGRAGLSAQITGQSTDKAGLQYKEEYNRISEYDNYWNVITRLAKHMGCIAFVKGDVLYVQPYDQSTGGVYVVRYSPPTLSSPAYSNAIKLAGDRNLHLSKNVKVNHKSWRHKQGEAIESEYQSTGAGSDTLQYTFKGANLTKAQQDQLAQTKLNEILSHEYNVSIQMPGDVSLTPDMMLQVIGTGTGFDHTYIISSIDHEWSEDGYQMTISSRNKGKKRGSASQSK